MSAPSSTALPSTVEAEVHGIRTLLERQKFAEGLAAAETLLGRVPENRDVFYLVAVSQRCLGRVADALRTLLRFESLHSDYGRLYQERGHCYRMVGESTLAIAAYLRAVERNPALTSSWQALADLYRAVGRDRDTEIAAREVARLAALPAAVVTASNLISEGQLYTAEQILRQFLLRHGDHIEAMRLLAQIGMQLDILDDADFLLESVLVFAPDYHAARYDYALVLSSRHKYLQAIEETKKLLRHNSQNYAYKMVYANAQVGLGEHEAALATFRALLTEAPAEAQHLHLSIGHAEKTLGRQHQAIAAYRAAAAARPSFGDAYWSLANLKTYRFTADEVSAMCLQEGDPATPAVDRYHFCFALGKALEDLGDYELAFGYYERGNSLKKAEVRYQSQLLERNTELQTQVCTRELFESCRESGSPRPDPIFIVGLPRAGSTLIEQILASHSAVEGTMELSDIHRLVQKLQGREDTTSKPLYPEVLAELSAKQLRDFGDAYLKDTQIYRTDRPFFIDKNPNNFRHLGLIQLILPNAKIIDARREPMACCFSNFKQLFASGQEFTYSLEDIARYYRTYVELMAHWDAVLPGKVLRVQHEDVVADLEGSVRRILEFCGLGFESACVEFYKTERSVRTASSEQVRQPIFREGLDQWRRFAHWLRPLREALGDLGSPHF